MKIEIKIDESCIEPKIVIVTDRVTDKINEIIKKLSVEPSEVLAGFSKIDSVISGCFYTDDDDSTIADLARSLGVNLKFTSYTRYCSKER